MPDLAFGTGHGEYFLRAFHDCELGRVADVYRQMLARSPQSQDAINLVANITKAARLAAIAIDGKFLAGQSLLHKIGNHPAIIQLHERTISVKDSSNAGMQLLIAMF